MGRRRRRGAGGGVIARAVAALACVLALGACTSTPPGAGGSPGVTLTSPGDPASPSPSPEAGVGDQPEPSGDAEADGEAEPAERSEAPEPLEPLEPVERDRARPVPLDEPGSPRDDVVARILEVDEVRGEAELPGEIAGDALQVTLELDNAGADALDLRGVVVNLYTGKARTPATTLSGPGVRDLPVVLPADGSARATFVFRVDDQEALLEIELDIADAPTIVVFTGRA